MKARQTILVSLIGLLLAFFLRCVASEAQLVIEQRGADVILYVTGGTNTVQYQIYTSPDNTVNSTNWYYWRRAYPLTEMLVFDATAPTNAAASKPQRFFQIRGVLPD